MFDIKEVQSVEATKTLAQQCWSAALPWLIVAWTCACFGC